MNATAGCGRLHETGAHNAPQKSNCRSSYAEHHTHVHPPACDHDHVHPPKRCGVATAENAGSLIPHPAGCNHRHEHAPAKPSLLTALSQNPVILALQAALSYLMIALIPLMVYGVYKIIAGAFTAP